MKKLLLALLFILMPWTAGFGETIRYELPSQMPVSVECKATVNGMEIPVYKTAVNDLRVWEANPQTSQASVAWAFSNEGFDVTLTYSDKEISSVVVRPLSRDIKPTVVGNKVMFTAPAPGALSVELNGSQADALHLFLEPLPSSAPDGAIVYEAGLHEIGTVNVMSGQTVYLAPGAVVRGRFKAVGKKNITICGSGIIDGSQFERWGQTTVPIELTACQNIVIRDLTILDPAGWTVSLCQCKQAEIENVKIISARSNGDGVTLQSCEDIDVRGCFVRSWDDSLVVKGYGSDSRNIHFSDCLLWTDLAQSMEIGYETRAKTIENITFSGITVLHANHKPVMSVHNSDSALVKDILFENIIVEDNAVSQGDGKPYLIELTTQPSQWSKTKERGNIDGVTFCGIQVLSGREPSIHIDAAKNTVIQNIAVKDLLFRGEEVLLDY